MNAKTQNIVAIIIGMVVIGTIGAALIPMMKMALTQSIVFTLQNGLQISYFSIYTFLFLWLAIPSFTGGYISCWIAKDRKIFSALVMGFLAFLTLLVTGITIGIFTLPTSLAALTIIPLAVMGGIVRRIIENKKEIENY